MPGLSFQHHRNGLGFNHDSQVELVNGTSDVPMTRYSSNVWPGKHAPLGATWDGQGVNFAIFSEHAERVELCLFDATTNSQTESINLTENTDWVRSEERRVGQDVEAWWWTE